MVEALSAETLGKKIDESIETYVIGGTDDYPVINRTGLIGDLAEFFASQPLAQPVPSVVSVKPLEWGLTTQSQSLRSGGVFGPYVIEKGDGNFRLYREGYQLLSKHPSEDEAKAAAQTDYATRILSALTTGTPAEPTRAEVLEVALREVREAIVVQARDTLWMRSGMETVVDFIDAALSSTTRDTAAAGEP